MLVLEAHYFQLYSNALRRAFVLMEWSIGCVGMVQDSGYSKY
jgi:hypothetical protein